MKGYEWPYAVPDPNEVEGLRRWFLALTAPDDLQDADEWTLALSDGDQPVTRGEWFLALRLLPGEGEPVDRGPYRRNMPALSRALVARIPFAWLTAPSGPRGQWMRSGQCRPPG